MRKLGGTHEISVESNEEHDVIVQHSWDELSNGMVSVTGEATVRGARG